MRIPVSELGFHPLASPTPRVQIHARFYGIDWPLRPPAGSMAHVRRPRHRVQFALIVLLAMILLCSRRTSMDHRLQTDQPNPGAPIQQPDARMALSDLEPAG